MRLTIFEEPVEVCEDNPGLAILEFDFDNDKGIPYAVAMKKRQ